MRVGNSVSRVVRGGHIMYDTLTEFIKTLSAHHQVLWALLVMAVVAGTSLLLFSLWEVVLAHLSVKKNDRHPTG